MSVKTHLPRSISGALYRISDAHQKSWVCQSSRFSTEHCPLILSHKSRLFLRAGFTDCRGIVGQSCRQRDQNLIDHRRRHHRLRSWAWVGDSFSFERCWFRFGHVRALRCRSTVSSCLCRDRRLAKDPGYRYFPEILGYFLALAMVVMSSSLEIRPPELQLLWTKTWDLDFSIASQNRQATSHATSSSYAMASALCYYSRIFTRVLCQPLLSTEKQLSTTLYLSIVFCEQIHLRRSPAD